MRFQRSANTIIFLIFLSLGYSQRMASQNCMKQRRMTTVSELILELMKMNGFVIPQEESLAFYIPKIEWEEEKVEHSDSVFVRWCDTEFLILNQTDSSLYLCSSGVNYQMNDSTLSLAVESVSLWKLQKRLLQQLPQFRNIYSESIFKKTSKWSKVDQLSIAENVIVLNGVEYILWGGEVSFNRMKELEESEQLGTVRTFLVAH